MVLETVPLAHYLFTRLRSLGADSIFGLPGDYNLRLLDHVEPAGLQWIGNCNELNAGYAADGYSRIKGIGALITTFGVGELSAVNAIAGAYSERAPVVHIVGTPPRAIQESRTCVHHTFKDGDFKHFDRIQEHVTVAHTVIKDCLSAPIEIDRVLQQCLLHSRPVRITIPDDMPGLDVDGARLRDSLVLPSVISQNSEAEALEAVLGRIYSSEKPLLLVDGESRFMGILDEVMSFVQRTDWPTFTTGFGKGLIDESIPNVHGVYKPCHKTLVDSCDLVIVFGPHYSTSNTYLGQTIPGKDVSIHVMPDSIKTNDNVFRDILAKHFLQRLLAVLDFAKISKHSLNLAITSENLTTTRTKDQEVTQRNGLWQRLSSFLQEGDIVLAETGTAGYAANDFILPRHARLFRPVTWLSIGYMLPAALGTSLSQRDMIHRGQYHRLSSARTVLLIGDGSFQQTAQELSTIIHHKLNVVVFLLNNDGYTIERCIHGRNQGYNGITHWRYLRAPAFFGAPEKGDYASHTWMVRTFGDLEAALTDENMVYGKGLRMVEIQLDRLDAPDQLLGWLDKQISKEQNV
ncbi:pyruvate decarboxylase [Aspergillus sclerotialis]|uniref:Pyruvate decarboxylase n=1 Tax=Aspergillus sclerotialis TaxID=2070753 RepID=A0A3A2ZLK5_9EURO|nr:pyruvate decarboxylase [Aspergillus sclerotialis]